VIAVGGVALVAAGTLAVCLAAERARRMRESASLTARLTDLAEESSRQIQSFARISAIIASSQQRDQLLSQIIIVLCDYLPGCAVRLLVYHKDGSLERIGSTLAQSSPAQPGGGKPGLKPNDENLMHLIAVPSGGKRNPEWDLFLDDGARLDFAYDFPFIAEEEFKGALVVTSRRALGERERLFLGDIATLIASAHQYVLTADQKDAINEQFGKSVDPMVRDHLLSAKEAGAMLDVSVLFLDVRNFTARSERLGPIETVRFLNGLFESCDSIVREEGGFINKFTGDGFMAVFGAPVRNATHPADAVRAARRILEKLDDVSVGIGIATGQALAGTIGSERRMEYTVIGDTVNTASRVEGLCKIFGAELMVTGETFGRSVNVAGDSRYLGKVRLKGKERAIDIYELRNGNEKSGECWNGEFERAISAYYRGNFDEAGNAFAALAERYPDDRAISWYGARCAERATGNAAAWDGVEQMTSK
jgi:class 3 adenylate cyclase